MTPKHILVGLDGSPLAETVLPFVAELAHRAGSRVTLLNVTHVPEDIVPGGGPGVAEVIERNQGRARDYLREQESRFRQAGIKVASEVVVGDTARAILEYGQKAKADLIALATHGRSGMQRWQHGSVADELLHTTTLPLLLIRPGNGWDAVPHDVRRIVVPLDGSSLAEAALPIAETLAGRLEVPLVLLRVIEPVGLDFLVDPTGTVYLNYQGILDSLRTAAEEYLAGVRSRLLGKQLEVERNVSIGMPARTIETYLHQHPGSMLVLATHGRSGLKRILLGSVARQLVQHAGVPTLLYHATERDRDEKSEARS